MKKTLSLLFLLALPLAVWSQDVSVEKARHFGPLTVSEPIILDSATLDGKRYSSDKAIDTPVSFAALKKAASSPLPFNEGVVGSLNLCSFSFRLGSYTSVSVKAEGPRQKKVYIAGREGAEQTLVPGDYEVVVKYIADSTALSLSLSAGKEGALSLRHDGQKRAFNLDDNMELRRYADLALSPSGRYLYSCTQHFNNEGRTIWESKITELATGRIVARGGGRFQWMPRSDRYYQVKTENGERQLIATDPATGEEQMIARGLPADGFTISPTEDYLIYNIYNAGPEKPKDVYEVVHPNDRQPYYRGRNALARFDFATGLSTQLTYGRHNASLADISDDGRYLLYSVQRDFVGQRPSEIQSIYRLDLETMQNDLLVDRQGFISQVAFVPGSANRLVVSGTAEAFDGIGRNLPDDMTPSMYEFQLFLFDVDTKTATPLTKHFTPSISSLVPSPADGQVYFTAENADSVSIYRLDPRSLTIQPIPQPLEVVGNLSVADCSGLLAFYGTSTCVSDRLYILSKPERKGKKQKQTDDWQLSLFEDPNQERMAEIQLGECRPYRMQTSRGYYVTGFYVLPADFDQTRKYPVIVDYYGGCSPTSHRFGGGAHYPFHYWNSMGYVVLVVNPSGASGFGQEWAARHVNTAGEGVAEDIIEATEWFADSHPWVNKEKIGCVSASYGGFMTQTLLSKTDLFATGISHAGISDHTSYWGEGYWGYTYSEVSMANSYPWTRKDLYVDRSPLYNADKIHKPILFTHGTADTNVPPGESIQMYTAMRILGVPTAFVMIEGEDHGIMDYGKRKKWIDTMLAWFHRWLQDDPTWWNALYPSVLE